MRVLHVGSGNMYGGVETFLATLAREADAAPGMESRFALCFEGRLSAELEALHRAPHLLGPASLSRPHTVLRARRELRNLLQREPCDVVVCHQPWTCVLFAPVIRTAGLPVVLWVHMASRGHHWLERLCRFMRPDVAICNSRFTAGLVSGWLPGARVEQVYCPVSAPPASGDRATRLRIRQEFQTSDRDVVIVQVSRLESWKGQHVLVSALARLRELPGWTCWLVGGPQHPRETGYLGELKLGTRAGGIEDRVRFVGDRRDVCDVLAAADVFCQPNTAPEPFGLALVEALYAGLPIVTSNVGGACEVVNESCGILTQPGDVNDLSSALRRLVVDRQLRARLSVEAQGRPKTLCDVSRQMRRIEVTLGGVRHPRLPRARAVEPEVR